MSRSSADRFQIYQRENKTFLLRFTSPDQVDEDESSATYNPLGLVDLTGATVLFRIKKNTADVDPSIVAKDSGTPAQITIQTQTPLPWTAASTLGEAKVFLVPIDTDPVLNLLLAALEESLRTGVFFFDSWVVLPGGAQKIGVTPTAIDILEAVTDF